MSTQKRQFITDEAGKPVAVILPLEDFERVRSILEPNLTDEENLDLMRDAAKAPDFLADLHETLNDFRHVDAEWWESAK